MGDYDDIKRQAEQMFGRNAVEQFEKELGNRSGESDQEPRRSGLVDVQGVRFEPNRENRASNTAKRDEEVFKNVNENVAASNKRELERVKARSNPDQTSDRSASERLLAEAIKGEYRYGMLGLILGIASIIGGMVLCLHGVAGATSWTAKLLGFESKVNDAAPGVVLFIVGLFFVWVTKPKVRMKDLQG